MATKFSASSTHNINFTDEATDGDDLFLATAGKVKLNRSISWADGTGTGATRTPATGAIKAYANEGVGKEYSIAAGATQAVDLAGILTDRHGGVVSFTSARLLRVENMSPDITLTVKPGAATPMTTIITGTTPTVKVPPLGHVEFCAPKSGFAVTAGSADNIDVTADSPAGISGGTFRVVILGTIA